MIATNDNKLNKPTKAVEKSTFINVKLDKKDFIRVSADAVQYRFYDANKIELTVWFQKKFMDGEFTQFNSVGINTKWTYDVTMVSTGEKHTVNAEVLIGLLVEYK